MGGTGGSGSTGKIVGARRLSTTQKTVAATTLKDVGKTRGPMWVVTPRGFTPEVG
jgi:hypothetical protein